MFGHQYTHEEIMFILWNYRDYGHRELTALINQRFSLDLTESQIKGFLANHHLNSGRTGYFPKGNVPYNKGTHTCAPGCEKTQFAPGHTPANHRPVGSERINVDGYTEVKIAEPKKWRMKHVLVWEAANGPVPKGHTVIFGDGDHANFALDNLILVTRGELAVLNHSGLIQGDADLTRTGVLITRVLMECRNKKRQKSR